MDLIFELDTLRQKLPHARELIDEAISIERTAAMARHLRMQNYAAEWDRRLRPLLARIGQEARTLGADAVDWYM